MFTTNLINNNPFSIQDSGSFPLPLYKKMGPKNIDPYHQRTRTNIKAKRKFSAVLIWDEFIFSVIARGKLHVPLGAGAFTCHPGAGLCLHTLALARVNKHPWTVQGQRRRQRGGGTHEWQRDISLLEHLFSLSLFAKARAAATSRGRTRKKNTSSPFRSEVSLSEGAKPWRRNKSYLVLPPPDS